MFNGRQIAGAHCGQRRGRLQWTYRLLDLLPIVKEVASYRRRSQFINLGLGGCLDVVCIPIGLAIFALCIDDATTYRLPRSPLSQAESQ